MRQNAPLPWCCWCWCCCWFFFCCCFCPFYFSLIISRGHFICFMTADCLLFNGYFCYKNVEKFYLVQACWSRWYNYASAFVKACFEIDASWLCWKISAVFFNVFHAYNVVYFCSYCFVCCRRLCSLCQDVFIWQILPFPYLRKKDTVSSLSFFDWQLKSGVLAKFCLLCRLPLLLF